MINRTFSSIKYKTISVNDVKNEAEVISYMEKYLGYTVHKITSTVEIRGVLNSIKILQEKCPNFEEIVDLFERNKKGRPDTIIEKHGMYTFAELKLNDDSLKKVQFSFLNKLSELDKNVSVYHFFSDIPKLSQLKPKIKEKPIDYTIQRPENIRSDANKFYKIWYNSYYSYFVELRDKDSNLLFVSDLSKSYSNESLCALAAIKFICQYHIDNFINEKMIIECLSNYLIKGITRNMWMWNENNWRKKDGRMVYSFILWRSVYLLWSNHKENWWIQHANFPKGYNKMQELGWVLA